MPDAPVRFAIVGLGMGRNRARIVHRTDGARLACICSLDEDQARATADELDCDWTTSMDDLLARPDVDVVGVMTPSGTHCELATRALEAGKHAFVTKPMDVRVEACDRAIEAARLANRLLAVDFEARYTEPNRRVRAAIRQGRLGRVFLADLRMKWFRAQTYYEGGIPAGWRSRLATEGGSIANQGVHYLDLIQWWLGPVRSVHGRSATIGHQIDTEDITNALLEFESGAWGVLVTTTASNPDLGTVIELNGTGGAIVWRDNGVERYVIPGDPDATLEGIDLEPGPRNIVEDMISAIRNSTPVASPAESGRETVRIFNAIYESSRTGETVTLRR